MDIFDEIRQLNFPVEEYVVVGSGIMDALGIKKSHDVDLVVTPELFEKCRAEGSWGVVPWTYPGTEGNIFLRRGHVELFLDVNHEDYAVATEELMSDVVMIQGVPFISLQRLMAFKKAYNREKHLKDIALIEKYLDGLKM